MKPEHSNLTSTELAILTWYRPGNPLRNDPGHPTIKLAGEIGELLDLYGKDRYKPNFSWMNCKYCGYGDASHSMDEYETCSDGLERTYTPIVLDELGDIWYYLRILAWQSGTTLWIPEPDNFDNLECIQEMYKNASFLFYLKLDDIEVTLQEIYYYLNILLANLDYTLEELTLLNYYKLNSEETNHGWADAR